MSADSPRLRPPRRLDDLNCDRPDDLFGGELETMPMPAKPVELVVSYPGGEAQTASTPVAPSNRGRWQKGCGSPNPNGRPPKSAAGALTKMMSRKVKVTVDGEQVTMTLRKYLDLSIMDQAARGDLEALDLWEERLVRDRAMQEGIEQRRLESEGIKAWRVANPDLATRQGIETVNNALFKYFEKLDNHCSGGVSAVMRLEELGVIEMGDGGFVIVDRILRKLRGLPPE